MGLYWAKVRTCVYPSVSADRHFSKTTKLCFCFLL